MKTLLFIVLSSVFYASSAIELYSCTDKTGKTHYTNLPKNSLDTNCKIKDLHAVMLQQDYNNLKNIHSKRELGQNDTSTGFIETKINDVLDADKAFDELMEATEDRDDVFTRAIRGRTESIKNTLKQGNTDSP